MLPVPGTHDHGGCSDRSPVHLGMYSWGTQASLTRSFTQVIPALGSLEHTILANPSFSVWPMPLPQVGGNKTDSGISSVSHFTLVRPRGLDKHLTSTPKTQPKLMQAAHQLTAELSTKWQGAPHGAHIQDCEGSTWKSWGGGFWGWQAPSKIHNASLNSSLVSLDDHTQLSTKLLMERDNPTRNRSALSGGEDILSIHDSSDIEMISIEDVPEHPSRDSAPVSGSEDDGEMPANDPGSGGHSDSNQESDSRDEDSPSGLSTGSSSDSPSSNDDDEFSNMFSPRGTLQPIKRKPESRAQSNSCSRS